MSQFRIYLLHFQSVIDGESPDSSKDFFISLNHARLLEEELGEIAWDLNDMRQMFSGRELIVRTLQFDRDATDEAIVGQTSDLIKTRPIQDFAIVVACGKGRNFWGHAGTGDRRNQYLVVFRQKQRREHHEDESTNQRHSG